MQRTSVGDVEAVALVDNLIPFPATSVYPDAGDELNAYDPYFDADGGIPLNFGCFLLIDGDRIVLVDTGWGASNKGKLLEELSVAGVAPGDVDQVTFTHLHTDHTGWNIDASGKATFANARYLIPAGDWAYYQDQDPKPDSFVHDVVTLETLGCMEMIEGETSITPSITAVPTPGHTPGHTSFAIASGGEYGFILGDVVISKVDAERPEFANSFDWDNGIARTTRLRTLDKLIEQAALVGASHLPAPGLGRFVRDDKGSRWEALSS
jgi:glyoxylase-like metal-dependent hydrolase (beta-lactamase superfamily II)